jgi:hypothetical protein
MHFIKKTEVDKRKIKAVIKEIIKANREEK